jgi:beta-lactamase class C
VPHAYDNLIEAKIDFKTIIDSMVNVDISAEPGHLYSYQNAIFSLIDTISSLKTSKKFNVLLNEKLFQPFNMRTATVGFKPFENNSNKAIPHIRIKDGFAPAKLNDRYYNTIPAAGINASISDMASFVQHLLRQESFYKNLTDTILEPQVYTPLRRSYFRRWGKVDSRHYGLGWRIVGYKGNTIAYHGGFVRGYRAEVALCREANIGIVYLSNSPSLTASISVPTFLNLYFDSIEQQKH